MSKTLTQCDVKKHFHYDCNTGVFIRVNRPCTKVHIGDIAGVLHNRGYYQLRIYRIKYLAHRIAWLYMTGSWPKGQIDHINHDRADNRWINLRDVTSGENQRNLSISKNNKSGVLGVCQDKSTKKWIAQIGVDGECMYLGLYKNKEDAISVRKEAEIKYGYHENHGK